VPSARFLFSHCGAEYKVTFFQRVLLLIRVMLNVCRIESKTSWVEHIVLIHEILNIPKSLEGDVIELGSYKGSSTASLSLVCSLTKRKLLVCDSFTGLPAPSSTDTVFNLKRGEFIRYQEGDSCASLKTVISNVAKYGQVEICQFVPGYFKDTLPTLQGKYVLIFEDADLPSSVKTALKYTWPRLQSGCKFFTEEARDLQIAMLFFDKRWWAKNFSSSCPGLVGAGIGLPIGPDGSGLGYATKRNQSKED